MSDLHLSRLTLNPRHRAVQHDLADAHDLHRRVMSAYPTIETEAAHAELQVLYRVELDARTGVPTIIVQGVGEPDWATLPAGYLLETSGANPEHKPVDRLYAAIAADARLRFRLRANPTRKIETKSGPNGEKRNGKRVELVQEADQLAWLGRQAERSGFALGPVQVRPDAALGARQRGHRAAGKNGLTHYAVVFGGVLAVIDPERFRAALAAGIGPGKAYGFGLLSIAPVGRNAL